MWCRRFCGKFTSLVLLLFSSSSIFSHTVAHNMTRMPSEVLDAAAIARITVRAVEGFEKPMIWDGPCVRARGGTIAHIPHGD